MSWENFEREARRYAGWYETPHGRRVLRGEQSLLEWLLAPFPSARSALEVGCGAGHFARWLSEKGLRPVGLDRSPAMLGEMGRLFPSIPMVIADSCRLPMRAGAVDLSLFVTTLEFVDDPTAALSEAVRVARLGVVAVVLNRYSLGGLSRRWGAQGRSPLRGDARDFSLGVLRRALGIAAGHRLLNVRWASALFPGPLWGLKLPIPLGDVIGASAALGACRSKPSGDLEQQR